MLIPLLLLWLTPTFAGAADFGVVKTIVGTAARGSSALKPGDAVRLNDTITTGPKSLVRIVLAEGVALQLGPDSSLRLSRPAHEPTTLELLKGYVLTRVKKSNPLPAGDKLRVKTPAASLGVRGTTFFTKDEKDGRTFLCVCEGTVKVAWNKGSRSITARHHDAPGWVVPGVKMMPVAPMGWEHNDAEIAALAKLLP